MTHEEYMMISTMVDDVQGDTGILPMQDPDPKILAELDRRRHDRILREDRRERRAYLGWGLVSTTPWAVMPYMDAITAPTMADPGNAGTLAALMTIGAMMLTAGSIFLPAPLLIGSLIPTKARRMLGGVPTYVPPAPVLDDGSIGADWSEDREDVLFERTNHLMRTVDDKAAPEEVARAIESFDRRVREIVGAERPYRSLQGSPWAYWPNKTSSPGTHDGDTVITYDDNLPLQGQKSRLESILEDVRSAFHDIRLGTDRQEIDIAVFDLVCVVRRIVELSGYDAGPLREESESRRLIPHARTLPKRIMPAKAAEALTRIRSTLEADPEAVDGLGNPIRPLIEHVERIVANHAAAGNGANEAENARLDERLDEAMEHVIAATRQAMDIARRRRQDEFDTDVLFLRSRHARTDLDEPAG